MTDAASDARRAQLRDNIDGALTQAYHAAGGSHHALAAREGIPRPTISRWLQRHSIKGGVPGGTQRGRKSSDQTQIGEQASGCSVDHVAGTGTLIGRPLAGPVDPDTLMRAFGLDPASWDVISCKVNAWEALSRGAGDDHEADIVTLHQTTLQLKRKVDLVPFVRPARADGWRPVKKAKRPTGRPTVGIVIGDQQFPFHDPQMHQAICAWLTDVAPDWGVLTGDTINASDISRHPPNPEVDDTLMQGIDAAYLGLRDYVSACERTSWTKLRGNHDQRIDDHVIQQAVKLWGLRRARADHDPQPGTVFDLSFLLRLDELGIQLHQPPGKWTHAQVIPTAGVAVRHKAAKSTLSRLTHSIIVGDSHRQSIRDVVRYDEARRPVQQLYHAETGCTCRLDGEGLGYTVEPDWQQGFAVITAWPDGTHHVDLARYRGGTLTWRDRAYRGT